MHFGQTALRFAVVMSLQLPIALATGGQAAAQDAPEAPAAPQAPTAPEEPTPPAPPAPPTPTTAPTPPSAPVEAVTAPPAAPAEEEVVGGDQKKSDAAIPSKEHQLEEDIVVTGSHIRRKDLTTAAPVVVITHQQIIDSGIATVGDYLQTLAQQGNGTNSQMNNPGDGSTEISLRSLGPERTLVLLNGRRMVGYGALSGVVDLNVIPTAVVDRIEVLLDGASGVYGSDAIAGVVNIITKKNYSGAEVETYQGISSHGDGYLADYTGTMGVTTEKGNVVLSLDYFNQQPILASSRSYSTQDLQENFLTGQILPLGSVGSGAGSFVAPCGAPGGTAALSQLCATPTGSGLYKVGGSPTGFSPFNIPLDYYNYQPENFNQTATERFSAFSSGEYHLTDDVKAYFEGLLAYRTVGLQLAPEPLENDSINQFPGTPTTGVPISANSMYNPFGAPITDAFRRMVEDGDRQQNYQYWTGRIVGGVTGVIPALNDWTWDLSLNYGVSTGAETLTGDFNAVNVANAIGPSQVVNGVPTCLGTAGDVNSAIPGCVPLNLLGGAGSISPAMLKYISYVGQDNFSEQMFEGQANASGDLFHLWSKSAVALAFGYDYRSERGQNQPDALQQAGLSTGNNSNATVGGFYLNEGYAELSIPIVSDQPMAHALEVVAALRISDYSTFGETTNYKFGGRWSPVKDVTLRGTVTSGFRAPSISDLYAGLEQSFLTVTDPCKTLGPTSPPALAAECAREGVPSGGSNDPRSQLNDLEGGNAALQPETSNSFTLGAVFEPRWVKNLSLTVDYYNLALYNAILDTGIGPAQIFSECYSGQDPALCNQIKRGPGGLINEILDVNQNVGYDKTDGIDFGLNYRFQLVPAAGAFGLLFNATWLHKYDQQEADGTIIHGVGNYDLGVLPDWKFTAGLTWAYHGFGASIFERFFDQYKECADSVGLAGSDGACYQLAANATALGVPQSTLVHEVPAYSITNINVSYSLKGTLGNTRIQLGINNVFDISPPVVLDSANTFATDPSAYDTIGRYFYAMLTQKFL